MIKLDLTFEDFDGNPVTESHWFHLSKNKLIEMELADSEGLAQKLTKVGTSGDAGEIMRAFKDVISSAYGVRPPENAQKFIQTPELSTEFMNSLAFDAMLTRLITDTNFAVDFVNGIVPKDLAELAAKTETVQLPTHPMAMVTDPDGIRKEIRDTKLPDPNRLDSSGSAWPRTDAISSAEDLAKKKRMVAEATFLANPYDDKGNLLSWAFREPTTKELHGMSKDQMFEVFQRKQSGWSPRDTTPSD